jgi:hypothetical protein
MILLLATPLPNSRQQVVSLSQSFCVSPVQLTDGKGRGWGRRKSYYSEKVWTSINLAAMRFSLFTEKKKIVKEVTNATST